MPHNHKRKRGQGDKSHFDLPPNARAKSLSVKKPKTTMLSLSTDAGVKPNKRRKPNKAADGVMGKKVIDDTPKRFARLMAWSKEGKSLRKGLDDGSTREKAKKNKKLSKSSVSQRIEARAQDVTTETKEAPSIEPVTNGAKPLSNAQSNLSSSADKSLKILPGERLRDFAVRVDQSLPLSSVPRHSTKETLKIPGVKSKQNLTKHNRRLLRMQDQWREEEKRRKDKRAENDDEVEDRKEEESLLWTGIEGAKNSRKGKKRKGGEDNGDIWKALESKKADMKGRGLTAGDTVQEPPKLGKIKNMFKEPASGKRGIAVG